MVIINDDLIPERYHALFEAVSKCAHHYNNNSALSFERNFQKVLKLLTSPVAAKILYTLKHIEFSSQSELNNSKKLGLGSKANISTAIADLELFGIVKRIDKGDPKLDFIKAFWRVHYPTSPYEPRFYIISSEFKKVIDLYSEVFEKRYIWKRMLSEIHIRKRELEKFTNENKKEIENKQKLEADKIGKCEICKKIITKSTDRSTYTTFNCGVYACKTCVVPKNLLSKWMRKSKL